MSQSISGNLYLRTRPRRSLKRDIDAVLASWCRPGQVNLLGVSALVGTVKHAEARARHSYYAHSVGICASVLALVIAVGFVGHMTSLFDG